MTTVLLARPPRPFAISRNVLTALWFWHCRSCPASPSVGYALSQGAALLAAEAHAKTPQHFDPKEIS